MDVRNRGRVLVFGDDMRIFLAIARSLGRAGIEVQAVPFDWRAPALKSRYVTRIHHLARYTDEPEAWLAGVQGILANQPFDLVIPCCDRAIIALDKHRHELPGAILAIPNPLSMEVLFDKQQTRELCRQLGIPAMRGRPLKAGDTGLGLAEELGLPLVVKPRRSVSADNLEAWERVTIARSVAELNALLSTQGQSSRYLAESFFEGAGVGVSVLASEGKILQAFQHRRLREGRAGPSTYRVSEALHPGLYEACTKICRHTGLNGVCMFEFRYNLDRGDWVLLETNARFWGSMGLPVAIGVDFPRLLYELLAEGRQALATAYPVGVRSRNFMLDGLSLLGNLRHLRPGEFGNWCRHVGDFLLQPYRWMTGREYSDSIVGDDLGPALWECLLVARMLARRLTGEIPKGGYRRRRSDAAAPPPRVREAA